MLHSRKNLDRSRQVLPSRNDSVGGVGGKTVDTPPDSSFDGTHIMCAQILGPNGGRLRERFSLLVCLIPLLVLTHSASAVPLTAWNFAANNGNEPSVNSTFVAPGFQTTAITRGGFQSPQISPGSFSNASWPFNPVPDGFFQFSISPLAGTTYTITDILFEFVNQVQGPVTWLLRSDADGYVSNLETWFASPTHTSILPATTDFQNLTTARSFRLYGLNSSGGGAGLTRLDINGSPRASTVPETLPFGAFGLTVTMLLFVRSRVKG
jgi:hypothetical protein